MSDDGNAAGSHDLRRSLTQLDTAPHRRLDRVPGRGGGVVNRSLVLVVGGSAEVSDLVHSWSSRPIDVRGCESLPAALLLVGRMDPNAIVIGGTSGTMRPLEFLEALRSEYADLPVIIGLDATQWDLGVDALGAGATALVRRPFCADDLLRILGLADNVVSYATRSMTVDPAGRLRVDRTSPRMWLDGDEVMLPPMEYSLLRYMATRVGEILSRAELIEAAWGVGPSSNSLSVHLARLRRRLRSRRNEEWIRPVRGFGYQFVVPQARTQGLRA